MDHHPDRREDEVYCTACRTRYRPDDERAGAGCPACGHAAWIAATFFVADPVDRQPVSS